MVEYTAYSYLHINKWMNNLWQNKLERLSSISVQTAALDIWWWWAIGRFKFPITNYNNMFSTKSIASQIEIYISVCAFHYTVYLFACYTTPLHATSNSLIKIANFVKIHSHTRATNWHFQLENICSHIGSWFDEIFESTIIIFVYLFSFHFIWLFVLS